MNEQRDWKVVSRRKGCKVRFQSQESVIQQVKERVTEFDRVGKEKVQERVERLVESIQRKM
jgi:hypothetical protein